MSPDELDGLSWIAVPGSPELVSSPLKRLARRRPAAFQRPLARTLCGTPDDSRVLLVSAAGWTYAFGYQVGLGALAKEASLTSGVAMSFEHQPKRGLTLASFYRDGTLVRSLSDIQGGFETSGAPLPGEPALEGKLDGVTLEALARAWGADLAQLEWGSAGVVASPWVTSRTIAVTAAIVLLAAVAALLVTLPRRESCRAACERASRSHSSSTEDSLDRFAREEAARFGLAECLAQCGSK